MQLYTQLTLNVILRQLFLQHNDLHVFNFIIL